MELETFDAVQNSISKNKKRPFHLLLGNGFSMSYDPKIFSYNALQKFVTGAGDGAISRLFDIVGTTNFELVMRQLAVFGELVEVFDGPQSLREKSEASIAGLKQSLIEAIQALHPEHVFKVKEERSAACAAFLRRFMATGGSIFTTNYDLLLYWVLMRNKVAGGVDGFGRDREGVEEYVPESELQYSELRWGKHKATQAVHYVHGAVHLFDTGLEIVKEEYDGESHLLKRIADRVNGGDYPLFVTSGSADDKLRHIRHNRYLEFCYEKLASIGGSLVAFGFNFGEYDDHVIEAINRAAGQGPDVRLWSIYVGVYSNEGRERIEKLAPRFKCKVRIFDSKTIDVWGAA